MPAPKGNRSFSPSIKKTKETGQFFFWLALAAVVIFAWKDLSNFFSNLVPRGGDNATEADFNEANEEDKKALQKSISSGKKLSYGSSTYYEIANNIAQVGKESSIFVDEDSERKLILTELKKINNLSDWLQLKIDFKTRRFPASPFGLGSEPLNLTGLLHKFGSYNFGLINDYLSSKGITL